MTEQKAWQKGINIETLQAIEDFYEINHQRFSFSPFTEVNKPKIAAGLTDGSIRFAGEGADAVLYWFQKNAKVKTPVKCFDVTIATKLPGDLVITDIAYKDFKGLEKLQKILQDTRNQRVFISIWEEDTSLKQILVDNGFTKICSQYKSTAEIIGVYVSPKVLDLNPIDGSSSVEEIPAYEIASLVEVRPPGTFKQYTDRILEKVQALDFANHYSNYNKGKTWSALSIRGYSDDVTFIEKPAEVMKSKKWEEKYKDKEFVLQNTELHKLLQPELAQIIVEAFGKGFTFDRIRLMKLAPGGGELLRHSDLQDPDVGTADGKTMRFHIPIVTNFNVDFSCWDWNGVKQTRNFKEGCLFYLDQRKPHTVVNNGQTERIHLVFDVIANEHTRKLVADAYQTT